MRIQTKKGRVYFVSNGFDSYQYFMHIDKSESKNFIKRQWGSFIKCFDDIYKAIGV
jgi:hypothetical protein